MNASSWREIVYTRNASEAINLVAATWGAENLKEGDEVLLSVMEVCGGLGPCQVCSFIYYYLYSGQQITLHSNAVQFSSRVTACYNL